LRPGVDVLRFVKVDFESVVGQTFLYTNIYTAVTVTNGVRFTNTYQIIQGGPNFLFVASELPINRPNEIPSLIGRSGAAPPAWINDAGINGVGNQGAAGPGIIDGTVQITFSKIGPSITNTQPGDDSEETARNASILGFTGANLIWGSFDGSTKPPIVYPEDVTLQDLENLVLQPQQ